MAAHNNTSSCSFARVACTLAIAAFALAGNAHAEPATGDLQIDVNINATTGGDAVQSEAVNSQVESSPTTGDGATGDAYSDNDDEGYLEAAPEAAPVVEHAHEYAPEPELTPSPAAPQLECELCVRHHDHEADDEPTRRERRQARGTRWVLGLGGRAESIGEEVYGGGTFYVRRGGDRGFYVFGNLSAVGGYSGDFELTDDDGDKRGLRRRHQRAPYPVCRTRVRSADLPPPSHRR